MARDKEREDSMTDTKHTPTPWDASDRENYSLIFGKGFEKPIATCDSYSKGFGPSKDERKANAAHIVKCVNMHDELVENLKFMYDNDGQYIEMVKLANIEDILKKAGAL